MYRTDKQFMKNPATAPSRIYIGGIPKAIIADDLEAKFSKHGKILGLVVNSGFAFIQYEFENEAQSAIRMENGTMMMGRKIIVRQSFAGKDSGAPPNKSVAPVKVDAVSQGRENEPVGGNNRVQDDRNMKFEPPEEPKKPIDTQTKVGLRIHSIIHWFNQACFISPRNTKICSVRKVGFFISVGS